jgi:lysophospholipase L1-like esterase
LSYNCAAHADLWRSVHKSALYFLYLAVLLAILITVSACAGQQSPEPAAQARFLALGDSYTIGEGVPAAERWPVQLAGLLHERGRPVNPPQIIARTGWTTSDLESALDQADLTPPYDLVTLLIGVNDQFRGWSANRYRDGFASLLGRAINLAGGDPQRVIVLSIPDYGVTPFGQRWDPQTIRSEIDRFNEINLELTQEAGARYVDVTPVSREAGGDPSLLASDGLHPSGKMYAQWAQSALPVALAVLGAETP